MFAAARPASTASSSNSAAQAAANSSWSSGLRGSGNGTSASKTPPRRKPSNRSSSKTHKNTIKVAVRVRPLSKQERSGNDKVTVDVVQNKLLTIRDPKDKASTNDPLYRSRETHYQFDVAMEADQTTRQLYDLACSDIVDKVVNGIHGTVFAYGATGSGKTYTMSGSEDNPGIMYFLISDLFTALKSKPYPIEVVASYLEIYNEEIRDLLYESSPSDASIELREDPEKGITVAGITEYKMDNPSDVFNILKQGARRRTTDKHNLNEASSRSHAVLIITVNQYGRPSIGANKDPLLSSSSNLTMIDLAGSERAKKTGATKKMLREGAKINRSLLALANCINALGQSKKRGLYIPYRDSKLTRMLKESLGGGAHTLMIANVSSASSQFDETRETLLYANRAKDIKINAGLLKEREERARKLFEKRNVERLVSEFEEELVDLKTTLSPTRKLRVQLGSPTASHRHFTFRESSSTEIMPYEPADAKTNDSVGPLPSQGTSSASSQVATGTARGNRHHHHRMSVVEAQQAQLLVNKIISNFQERIQIRRSLVELEEMDALNRNELEQNKLVVAPHLDNMDQAPSDVQAANTAITELTAALEENEKYRQKQSHYLTELKMQGAQLRRLVQAKSFKPERQQLVHLTVDRCVLELQKMELELQQRVTKMDLEERQHEAQYYKQLLIRNGVSFRPYDPSNTGRTRPDFPLPKVPNLRAPNPSVRSVLGTPRNPSSSSSAPLSLINATANMPATGGVLRITRGSGDSAPGAVHPRAGAGRAPTELSPIEDVSSPDISPQKPPTALEDSLNANATTKSLPASSKQRQRRVKRALKFELSRSHPVPASRRSTAAVKATSSSLNNSIQSTASDVSQLSTGPSVQSARSSTDTNASVGSTGSHRGSKSRSLPSSPTRAGQAQTSAKVGVSASGSLNSSQEELSMLVREYDRASSQMGKHNPAANSSPLSAGMPKSRAAFAAKPPELQPAVSDPTSRNAMGSQWAPPTTYSRGNANGRVGGVGRYTAAAQGRHAVPTRPSRPLPSDSAPPGQGPTAGRGRRLRAHRLVHSSTVSTLHTKAQAHAGLYVGNAPQRRAGPSNGHRYAKNYSRPRRSVSTTDLSVMGHNVRGGGAGVRKDRPKARAWR